MQVQHVTSYIYVFCSKKTVKNQHKSEIVIYQLIFTYRHKKAGKEKKRSRKLIQHSMRVKSSAFNSHLSTLFKQEYIQAKYIYTRLA
ncbi:hypothetical protein DU38_11415 [Methanosarcina mazei]|uniref:Uncharacterized protein n=1 Tax=Methanosarcina mazei TaxID=2209 RepID=A0A0F8HBG0_METMZ|nr:hypothetical protein DU49_09310 [Methanosarcina mazei]KKG37532.1 hypothetical protein DU35_02275 [Methanosarcina mazei]KKG39788.1 hypothetical protein DU41_18310 [Methanosarcina mazei]KKG41945.1 hypothetical protein DU39_09730 [Methanosarcina mazei]KKG53648.1 hypothetical protein DU38_11415 [Methanosarcina mazei]